jgi:hypothetical protein
MRQLALGLAAAAGALLAPAWAETHSSGAMNMPPLVQEDPRITPDANVGVAYGWVKGTTWNWNNWRYVHFGFDGEFSAPDSHCGTVGQCRWSADAELLYIDWGEAGRHSVTASVDAGGVLVLEGTRVVDGDRCRATHVSQTRGIPPAQLEQHAKLFGSTAPEGAAWHCRADNQSLPLSRVNDDYCDCGDDEPQTAACAGWAGAGFWCSNEGFMGKFVASSRVGDSICDCCDGSDEPTGSCTGSCAAQVDAANVVIEKRAAMVRAAIGRRLAKAEAGRRAQQEWAAALPQKQAELDALLPRVAAVEAEHGAYQVAEAERQAAHAAALAAAVAAEPTPVPGPTVDPPPTTGIDACDWDGALPSSVGGAVEADYQDLGMWLPATVEAVDTTTGEYTVRYKDDEVEAGIPLFRLRPRLPECPAAAPVAAWQAVCAAHRCGSVCVAGCAPGYHGDSGPSAVPYMCKSDGGWHPAGWDAVAGRTAGALRCKLSPPAMPHVHKIGRLDAALEVEFFFDAANEATYRIAARPAAAGVDAPAEVEIGLTAVDGGRVTLPGLRNDVVYELEVVAKNAAGERRWSASAAPSGVPARFAATVAANMTLPGELKSLKRKVGLDLGPDARYFELLDVCVEKTEGDSTYKLCGFGKIRQEHGGKKTKLGVFRGWLEGNATAALHYAGGQSCGPHGNREATVNLRCGEATSIEAVSEPSRCRYQFTLVTPAACEEDDIPLLFGPVPSALAASQMARAGAPTGVGAGHTEL